MSLLIGLGSQLVFFVVLRSAREEKFNVRGSGEFQLSKEGADDPIVRARQEWMQLRDQYTNEIPKDIRSKELAYTKTLPNVEAFAKSRLQQAQLFPWTSHGPATEGRKTRALAFDLYDAIGNTIQAREVSGGMTPASVGVFRDTVEQNVIQQ